MAVDDAATLLETTWETDATTVGGLVTEALGHLPAPGETRRHRRLRVRGRAGRRSRRRSRSSVRRVVPATSEESRVMEILDPDRHHPAARPRQRAVRRRGVRDRRRTAGEHRAPGRAGQLAGASACSASSRIQAAGSLHRHDADRHLGRQPRARDVRRALAGGADRSHGSTASRRRAGSPRTPSPASSPSPSSPTCTS